MSLEKFQAVALIKVSAPELLIIFSIGVVSVYGGFRLVDEEL